MQRGLDPDSPRQETTEQRADRNLSELLAELRVALPGVQVLFAFLLVVPFNQRFATTTPLERILYLVTLLLAAASGVFLIAPSFHHRSQFRRQEKEHIVVVGNALAVTGLTLLALAMIGVVMLVTDVVYGIATAPAAAGGVAALFAFVWYAIPIDLQRRRAGRR